MRKPRLLLAVLLGTWLSGCAVGPNFQPPQIATPGAYVAGDMANTTRTSAEAATTSPAKAPSPGTKMAPALAPVAAEIPLWWHALGDKELDALVDSALKDNPSLEIALTRLQQARTLEVAVTGFALPRLEASSGGGRGTGSDLSRSRVAGPLQSADHSISASARITRISGFDAYWDIDLFGKIRREIEAARYDAQAAAAARDAVQVTVIASVVRAYVDLRGLQMQLAVLRQNLQAAQSLMDFVQARFDHGITNELDVTLARRQLASVEAEVAPLNAQVQAAQYAIAVLLGRFPEDMQKELAQPGLIPQVPERIAPGLPLDLIRRRPDIRAAEWALAGATARVGIATANLFPQLSISGGLGIQGQGLGYTPASSQRIWSVGYAAALPLLDFGVLDAFANIADLQAHVQLVDYKQTVLRAIQEVDATIATFAAQQDRLTNLGEAVLASQRAMSLASERYDRGLTDFLNVADAQRQEYELEGQYAQAQTTLAEQFVAVYLALGGGWEQFGEPPPVRHSQPAIIAMFRRLISPGSGQ